MKKQKIFSSAVALCLLMGMLALPGCTGDKETEQTKRERNRDEATEVSDSEQTSLNEETIIIHPTDVTDNTDMTEVTIDGLTEAQTEVSSETEAEVTKVTEGDVVDPETPNSDVVADPAGSSLYEKAKKYIDSAIAFYNHLYDQDMKLVVFESQISETPEGFSFTVRSQAGKDANVYVSDVDANVETGVLTGDNGMTWNISDYS